MLGVSQPACTLERIAQATHRSMEKAKSEPRVPKAQMAQGWELGYGDAGWGLKPCGLLTLARQWLLQAGSGQGQALTIAKSKPFPVITVFDTECPKGGV